MQGVTNGASGGSAQRRARVRNDDNQTGAPADCLFRPHLVILPLSLSNLRALPLSLSLLLSRLLNSIPHLQRVSHPHHLPLPPPPSLSRSLPLRLSLSSSSLPFPFSLSLLHSPSLPHPDDHIASRIALSASTAVSWLTNRRSSVDKAFGIMRPRPATRTSASFDPLSLRKADCVRMCAPWAEWVVAIAH